MTSATKKQVRSLWRRLLSATADLLRSSTMLWRVVVATAAAAIVIAVSLRVWQNVRPHVETQPEYLVAPATVEINPAPPWIRANIKAEVIRDAGLHERLSILDERLRERLTQAFALHPWIEHVGTVETSYPAHIKIELTYRQPVAMVEVHGGLLPIDADGVLLPTEDFSPQQAQEYPRVAGVASSPLGPLGTRWGDPVVEAAAKLAPVLQSVWQPLNLHFIQPHSAANAPTSRQTLLEIVTRGGKAFFWGSAPGEEIGDEPKAANKLATLKRLAAQPGSLDGASEAQRDLRR